MPNTGCRTRLAQKAKPRRFISEISLADDFQRHRAAQIDVKRFISDPHRTATQFDRSTVFARHQFIMLKALLHLYWCRIGRFLQRRLAGRNPASKTPAKHADCSGKLITAARACALGLRAHFSNRPSARHEPALERDLFPAAKSGVGPDYESCIRFARPAGARQAVRTL